ncbi:unnamed protein product [Ectocarpus sp. 13 AM-2016]
MSPSSLATGSVMGEAGESRLKMPGNFARCSPIDRLKWWTAPLQDLTACFSGLHICIVHTVFCTGQFQEISCVSDRCRECSTTGAVSESQDPHLSMTHFRLQRINPSREPTAFSSGQVR